MTTSLPDAPQSKRLLRVFLCHAKDDKPAVRELHTRLKQGGVQPWLDEADLIGGQDWEMQIRRAVRQSDVVIVCLSKSSITSTGYVQKEIKFALDAADEHPEDDIYIIPLRLEECTVPDRLHKWHWVNLFEPNGYDKLLIALHEKAKQLGVREPQDIYQLAIGSNIQLDLVHVPAGEFLMGSADTDQYAQDDEKPQHKVYLSDYTIGKYPVTNTQFAIFAQAKQLRWRMQAGKENHPVVSISWDEAIAYCDWVSHVTNRRVSLPSEAEWEKAARGTDGRLWPWGNDWDAMKCNSGESGIGHTTPVNAYSQYASPYGCLDMCGNVWEWTRSLYEPYPYRVYDGRDNLDSHGVRVLRGGSFDYDRNNVRCACRSRYGPYFGLRFNGFRIVVSPISPTSVL